MGFREGLVGGRRFALRPTEALDFSEVRSKGFRGS